MGLQEGPVDGSEGCDGLQREQDEPTGGPTGIGEPTGELTGIGEPIYKPMGEPTDQFCSSYNQKKPLIDFGRFLTYSACQQRNIKANRV
jgi:hypothetical protein